MKSHRTVKFICAVLSLVGALCLLGVAQASDAEVIDHIGLLIGLAAGLLLVLLGTVGMRLQKLSVRRSRS